MTHNTTKTSCSKHSTKHVARPVIGYMINVRRDWSAERGSFTTRETVPACGSCLPSGGSRRFVCVVEVETMGNGVRAYESQRMSCGKARDLAEHFERTGSFVQRAFVREVVISKSLIIVDNANP